MCKTAKAPCQVFINSETRLSELVEGAEAEFSLVFSKRTRVPKCVPF